ncbi:unnamed protein product [Periconia digitata]|uniref:Uncharacterized protein n=1 Tax=Periconia digitata TaxID=1303443 RepID=A0A9W4XI27_9PLEO|nr:unnamed protein product [Periconia digitata]
MCIDAENHNKWFVPAKCISNPSELWWEMKKAVGLGNFRLEMQHNMYSIQTDCKTDRSLDAILRTFLQEQ